MFPKHTPYAESRLDWLKRVHSLDCPECRPAIVIPRNRLKITAFCPLCERVWKAEHYGLKLIWYHEQDHATAQEVLPTQKDEAKTWRS